MKENIFSFIFVFMILPTLWAGVSSDSTLGNDAIKSTIHYTSYILLVLNIVIITYFKYYRFDSCALILILTVVIYWFFYYFNYYLVQSPAILNIAFLLMFAIIKSHIKAKIYILVKYAMFISSIMGILLYFFTASGINIGQSIVPYYIDDGNGTRAYITFCGVSLFVQNLVVRLCGFLNEPGYFGTVVAIILTVEKCRMNKINIVLFIAGILSWSMAFFMIIFIDAIYFYKKYLVRVALIISIVGTGAMVSGAIEDDGNISNLIARFSFDEEKGLSGDNRSSGELDQVYYDTLCSNKALFGHGTGFANSITTTKANLSYKTLIIDQGVLGTLITYMGVILGALLKKYGEGKWLIFIFFASVYQRPNIFVILYFIVLYGGLDYLNYQRKVLC